MQRSPNNESESISRSLNKAPSMRTGTTTAERRPKASSSSKNNAQRKQMRKPAQTARTDNKRTARPVSDSDSLASSYDGFLDEKNDSVKSTKTRTNVRKTQTASRNPQTSASGKKRKKKSGKGFKRFLTVYIIVLALILIIGLIVFNSFIGNYEKNQPTNIAKNVVEELKSGNASTFLQSNADMISTIEDKNEVIDKYLATISGKDLSYVENSESRADAPSFDLRADGNTYGKITLSDDGTGSFGLKKWKLAAMDIAAYIPDTYSYTILAPSGYTVAINGNELSSSDITAENETPEILVNAEKFIKAAPKYDAYTAAGLLSIPTVTAKDDSGKDVGVAVATEYFVAGGEPSKEFIDEQKDFVEKALHDWAYHFIHYRADETNLAYYIQTGSDLYSYIFGSDEMDPIMTTFYDWENITNVEFTEFEANNYIRYTDDCYSVDVKYRLKVDFDNDKLSDDGQMLDATWVIVNNKNFWGIADVQYHQGSEDSLVTEAAQANTGDADTDDDKTGDEAAEPASNAAEDASTSTDTE